MLIRLLVDEAAKSLYREQVYVTVLQGLAGR